MGVVELTPAARIPLSQWLTQASDEERIRRIRMDRWIGYARAQAALSAMDELLLFPRRTRMPNLILVSATNNGKSMIAEKFARQHRTQQSPMCMPVLKVEMPSSPDEQRFFSDILAQLGVPDQLNARLMVRQDMAATLMRAARVRILVIDELHNVLVGSRPQQARFLNLLRRLGNTLRIPLVAVGTAAALRAVQSDDQLANRFMPFVLPLWQNDSEYLRLLNTLEAILPLHRVSGLSEPSLAHRIMTLAEGYLGEIVTLVNLAAVQAITSGEERISARTLDRVNFIPPSKRRYAAQQLISG
jgi:hypothetical protein